MRHNIILNLASSVLPIGIFLVTVPVYIKTIGLERYGILSLVWVLTGYVGFMNFGSGDALVHRIAALGNMDPASRERMVWSGLWTALGLGSVAAVVVGVLGQTVISLTVRGTPSLLLELRHALPWIMLSVVSSFLYSAISGIIEGMERFGIVNIARLVENFFGSVFPLIVALTVSPRLDFLVAATIAASLLPAVALLVVLIIILPLRRIHRPRWQDSRSMLGFGGWITVASLVLPLMTAFDRFIIGALLGPTAVGHYVVPQGIANRFMIVPVAVTRTLFPRISSIGEGQDALDLTSRAVRVVGAIMAPLCCGAILLVPLFLRWWISEAFSMAAGLIASLLFFAVFFNSVGLVPSNHLRGTGNPRIPALIFVAELLPFAGLAWVGIAHFGLIGAAVAWTIRVVVDCIVMSVFAGVDRQTLLNMLPLVGLLSIALGIATLALSPVLLIGTAFGLSGLVALVGLYVSSDMRGLVRAAIPPQLRFALPERS